MLLKTNKPIRNEAKKYLKIRQLHVNDGKEAEKYLKTNDIGS
jgi:hypothetical protein